ncbi:MAG: glycosyltransferase [Phycisphaerae bacterium]|nr:glycosyltransferase [Gemmatimonadaceae bacterium]
MTADTRPPVGRVLFVTHNIPRFPGDAAGSFVLRLAVALRNAGVEVDLLAPGSPELSGVDVIEGIEIERVRYAAPEHMTLAYSGRMAEDVRASWGGRFALAGLLYHMRRRIRKRVQHTIRQGRPYDIVHAHWWFPSGLSAWSAGVGASLPVPMVITMHGSDVRLAQGVGASHGVMRRVLQRATVVTAVSRWLAGAAMQIVPGVNVVVGPMPVDSRVFQLPHTNQPRHGVLFVGRLNAQKGVADLLAAFAAMRDRSVTMHVVGDGPDAEALRRQSEQLGIAGRVRWLGVLKQADLVPLYQQAAVLAIPSREEGLGLVAVEAQMCGAPVVAYASGGLTDVVLPESGGTLITTGSITALTAALDSFAADDDDARERGRIAAVTARAAMIDSFSPSAVAARYLALYKQAKG